MNCVATAVRTQYNICLEPLLSTPPSVPMPWNRTKPLEFSSYSALYIPLNEVPSGTVCTAKQEGSVEAHTTSSHMLSDRRNKTGWSRAYRYTHGICTEQATLKLLFRESDFGYGFAGERELEQLSSRKIFGYVLYGIIRQVTQSGNLRHDQWHHSQVQGYRRSIPALLQHKYRYQTAEFIDKQRCTCL